MSKWLHVDAYSSDQSGRELVISALAKALFNGELALFLGAGVSKAFGIPGWKSLVNRCIELTHAKCPPVASEEFEDLTRAAGICRSSVPLRQYIDAIKQALYSEFATSYEKSMLVSSPLLNAMGALMMGSRRGRVRDVWTLNYDDIIEWHLRSHGFVTQVVSQVPTLLKDVDVTVYHPHGYIPRDQRHGPRSEDVVFDDSSYSKRSVGHSQPWRGALQSALTSKVFLMVGLSWTDRLLKDLVINASSEIDDRPTAFWMFGPGTPPEHLSDCQRHNIVPIQLDSFDDYPSFLLNICEDSMDSISVD